MAREQDPTKTIAQECIGVRIRILNRVITRIYDDVLREHGITLAQLNILTATSLHGPLQPSRLVRILSIEKSTLSRNLRLMETNGWVRTRPGTGNTQNVQVTAAGRRLLRDAKPAWDDAQARTEELMGSRAVGALANVVSRISQDGESR